MKNAMILVLVLVLGFTSYTSMDFGGNGSRVDPQAKVVNDVFVEYHPLIVTAFDKAEKQFIKKVVIDDVQRMDPDPKICACKGTGLMPTDGGAVKLYCKYHGNRSSDDKITKMEARMAEIETGLSKEAVIDTPKPRATLQGILGEKEETKENSECKCTEQECKAGECGCKDCKCHEETKETEAVNLPEVPQIKLVRKDREKNTATNTCYQVIMFSADWCLPCKQFITGTLKELGETVDGLEFSKSANADFRVLDIDDADVKVFYLSSRKNATGEENKMIPMFLEIKDNVVISRKFGVENMDLQYLLDKYDLEETR